MDIKAKDDTHPDDITDADFLSLIEEDLTDAPPPTTVSDAPPPRTGGKKKLKKKDTEKVNKNNTRKEVVFSNFTRF